jgi:hypothetical protein
MMFGVLVGTGSHLWVVYRGANVLSLVSIAFIIRTFSPVARAFACRQLPVSVINELMSVMMTSANGNVRNAGAISDSTESVVTQSYSFPQLYFNHMTNQFVVKL